MESLPAELIFELRNVSYRYHEVTAVNSLSLAIARGQRIAILGANGSGKSTLLRLLDALYFPDSGTISFAGSNLTEAAFSDEAFAFDFRRRVGFVFQNPEVQLFNPTVYDEVAFGPLQLRWSKAEIKRRVAETLDLMEISQLATRAPHRLSGGEKKRVALASVLVLEPEVLLLDEPTSSLDPKSRGQMIDLLMGWKGNGRTLIITTHELDIVEDVADFCYVLQQGGIAAAGPVEQLLHDEEMLRRTNLLHAHRHRHPSGLVHSHSHNHRHHEHEH